MRSKFTIFSLLLVVLFALDILLGSEVVDLSAIFSEGSFSHNIIFNFRLPKALTAVMAGVALAVSGLLMQTVFRNPLAGPYILGVSAGASLGVAIFMLGVPLLGASVLKDLGVAFSAWAGAAVILVLVMAVSVRIKDIMAVLILGMMFGTAASAFVDILQYFSNEAALKGFVIWAMGSLGGLSEVKLAIMAVCVAAGLVMSLLSTKSLDLLLLGENYARSMGLNVTGTRILIFAATSLLAGSVTAFCGPIAFLGIAVPHMARMIFRRADHRVLLPASILIGADLMLLCDIIAGVPGYDLVLPINTITSLFGIPVVIMVVINSKRGKVM